MKSSARVLGLLAGAILLPAAPLLAGAGDVRIAADVDRDGVVDFERDEAGKGEWTPGRGAIFLFNNLDSAGSGRPNHADAIVNGPADLANLAPLRLRQLPGISAADRVTVTVDADSRPRVRLFVELAPEAWASVDLGRQGNIPPELLAAGDVELRIEANSYAGGGWSGETTVTARVDGIGEDAVVLRVAPWIMLPGTAEADVVHVRAVPGRNDAFIEQLEEIVPAAGARLDTVPADAPYPENNIWLQDALEAGYSEMPGRRVSAVLKANRNKPLDAFARERLLGPDTGWFEVGEYRPAFAAGVGGDSWLDWYGNLEVTPPLPGYPLGRVFHGVTNFEPGAPSLNPLIVEMLNAQGVQGPALALDVGWLRIKHVDEMLNFVPSGDPEHPWKALVPDFHAAIAFFQSLQEAGHGGLPILTTFEPGMTIDSLLASDELLAMNAGIQDRRIEPNIALIREELGLREEDIIRVPGLLKPSRQALIPNMVNSLILNGHVLAPDPNGPVLEGRDLLREHFRALLSGLPLEVHFLDDQHYHRWSGNVHCATNALRSGFEMPWWEYFETGEPGLIVDELQIYRLR